MMHVKKWALSSYAAFFMIGTLALVPVTASAAPQSQQEVAEMEDDVFDEIEQEVLNDVVKGIVQGNEEIRQETVIDDKAKVEPYP